MTVPDHARHRRAARPCRRDRDAGRVSPSQKGSRPPRPNPRSAARRKRRNPPRPSGGGPPRPPNGPSSPPGGPLASVEERHRARRVADRHGHPAGRTATAVRWRASASEEAPPPRRRGVRRGRSPTLERLRLDVVMIGFDAAVTHHARESSGSSGRTASRRCWRRSRSVVRRERVPRRRTRRAVAICLGSRGIAPALPAVQPEEERRLRGEQHGDEGDQRDGGAPVQAAIPERTLASSS